MKRFVTLLICFILLPCFAFADLEVYFLDVGQGDSAIIVCDGEAMIIDGGLPGQSSKIYAYIHDTLHLERILYMVATHPDNDHIGGLPAVFQAAKKVTKLFSPVDEDESPFFQTLVESAKKTTIKIPYDRNEESLGRATITFYNSGRKKKGIVRYIWNMITSIIRRDDPEENKENNDISLVVKIVYGETSFLFTGDIEKDAEERLINSPDVDLKADVLKVAHHGSNTSNSPEFLAKVNPKYAVISCGKGNRYGHPNQETLDELSHQNIEELYRTDLQGTIICRSDGHSIQFETEKTAQSNVYKAPEKQ